MIKEMGLSSGLTSLVFVCMAVVIVFLSFRVYETDSKVRETREADRNVVTDIARDTMRAFSQQNPVLSFETVTKSRTRFDQIIDRYGSIAAAEQALKLPDKLGPLQARILMVSDMTGGHLNDVVVANDDALSKEQKLNLGDSMLGLEETARMTNKSHRRAKDKGKSGKK